MKDKNQFYESMSDIITFQEWRNQHVYISSSVYMYLFLKPINHKVYNVIKYSDENEGLFTITGYI